MVLNLVGGGSLEFKAEKSIAIRTPAYNKAIKEYKKNIKLVQACLSKHFIE
jgi:hypothetical protein